MPVSGVYIKADEKSCGGREAYAKNIANTAEEAKCYEEPVSGTYIQIDDKSCGGRPMPIRFPMLKQLICIFKEKIASKSSQLTENKKHMIATRYEVL